MAIARCNFTNTWSLAIKFSLARVDYILKNVPHIKLMLRSLFEPPTGAKIMVFSDPTGTKLDQVDLPHYKALLEAS
jgi:hypothetical protein